ncbi:YBR230W-A [Saccharomyces arboricola H-6]|uniref:YBR230W-A n=1 Tax=Saccharomyces arboricola (strain H-6 / AS 2.3317 / CBS 10644) TaxID=1160507 RepID=J8LRB0_SACAR|nr:YBR230W-A [Saccharomyces arboricola H-6]
MRSELYRLWCVASAARGVARGSLTKANAALREYMHTSKLMGRWARDKQWEAAKALSQRVIREQAAK